VAADWLRQRYSRTDPRGRFPRVVGFPGVECNRLGVSWRPVIDMTDSPFAAVRLRAIIPVADWLADGGEHRSWFSMIGVPGLRRQVVLHAGLGEFDCSRPEGLSEELRTERWQSLVDLLGRFGELGDGTRALVVFHLAQLSFTECVFTVAGVVEPNGDPERDRYAYEVARVHSRHPARVASALRVFGRLPEVTTDPLLALGACFQGIGHAIRDRGDHSRAREFERQGSAVGGLTDDWHSCLVRSRFHRAVALLRLAEGDADAMRRELAYAVSLGDQLAADATGHADRLVAAENSRYLAELRIRTACAGEVPDLCAGLASLDPYCVEAKLVIGDALAGAGDVRSAAEWYANAGELGTVSGAIGWFRAGQCYDRLGDYPAAINAMGRCLELDATAVEPCAYLEGSAPAHPRARSRRPG
jgi:hypothetical protein